MTLQEFSTSGPSLTSIKFFVGNSKTIVAMNVSSTACNGINTFDALGSIQTLALTIGGTFYRFTILTRELKEGYYFFTVEPTYIPTLEDNVTDSDNLNCNFVTFLPSANDATFTNSEYNPTIGNAIETRLSSFHLDVNRIKSQVKPTNYERIISGTADFAPVPDSNYSSIGYTNGRYTGTKTTRADFGIDPAVIASEFKGAVYTINKNDNTICSQSLSARPIEDFLFAPNLKYKPSTQLSTESGGSVDALETPSIRLNLVEIGYSGLEFNNLSNTLTVNGNPNLVVSEHLLIVLDTLSNQKVNGNYEYLHISDITYNPGPDTTTVTITHQGFSKYGDTSSVTITSADKYIIYNVLGDSIYKPNGGQIYRIADKKLYVPETNKIFITDERGQLIYETRDCSI